jgi:polyhydroxyalkanoate synthesis regulator phasin
MSPAAQIQILVDLVECGIITAEEAKYFLQDPDEQKMSDFIKQCKEVIEHE